MRFLPHNRKACWISTHYLLDPGHKLKLGTNGPHLTLKPHVCLPDCCGTLSIQIREATDKLHFYLFIFFLVEKPNMIKLNQVKGEVTEGRKIGLYAPVTHCLKCVFVFCDLAELLSGCLSHYLSFLCLDLGELF